MTRRWSDRVAAALLAAPPRAGWHPDGVRQREVAACAGDDRGDGRPRRVGLVLEWHDRIRASGALDRWSRTAMPRATTPCRTGVDRHGRWRYAAAVKGATSAYAIRPFLRPGPTAGWAGHRSPIYLPAAKPAALRRVAHPVGMPARSTAGAARALPRPGQSQRRCCHTTAFRPEQPPVDAAQDGRSFTRCTLTAPAGSGRTSPAPRNRRATHGDWLSDRPWGTRCHPRAAAPPPAGGSSTTTATFKRGPAVDPGRGRDELRSRWYRHVQPLGHRRIDFAAPSVSRPTHESSPAPG